MVNFISAHQSFVSLDKASPLCGLIQSGLISLAFGIDVYFGLVCGHLVYKNHVATTYQFSFLERQEVVPSSFTVS
jgi:hypothetical protein